MASNDISKSLRVILNEMFGDIQSCLASFNG